MEIVNIKNKGLLLKEINNLITIKNTAFVHKKLLYVPLTLPKKIKK